MLWERREGLVTLSFAYQVARQFALKLVIGEQQRRKTEVYVGMDYPATFREPREFHTGFRLPAPPRLSPTKLQWRPRGSRATNRYEAERSERGMRRYTIGDASKLVGAGACGLTG